MSSVMHELNYIAKKRIMPTKSIFNYLIARTINYREVKEITETLKTLGLNITKNEYMTLLHLAETYQQAKDLIEEMEKKYKNIGSQFYVSLISKTNTIEEGKLLIQQLRDSGIDISEEVIKYRDIQEDIRKEVRETLFHSNNEINNNIVGNLDIELPEKEIGQSKINTPKAKEFDYLLFEKDLNNMKYIIGEKKKTKYYVLVIKISPLWNLESKFTRYKVYLLEDNRVVIMKEIHSEEYKNILTEARKEGVQLLHQLNPYVNIKDVSMVHYKQDRPEANPWQNEKKKVLFDLFEQFAVNNKMKTIIEDIDSELSEEEVYYKDGVTIYYYGKRYERNPLNRAKAIEIHGLNCVCCGFNFEKMYGDRGKDFIEIHHLNPLSTIQEEIEINPETDLVPVCSNCHRMIHRKKDEILTIEELQKLLKSNFEK